MSNAKVPRAWPNNAKWARDDSAKLADAIVVKLEKLIGSWHDIDETSKVIIISQCQQKAADIRRKLEAIGAQTRP